MRLHFPCLILQSFLRVRYLYNVRTKKIESFKNRSFSYVGSVTERSGAPFLERRF